MKGTKIAVFLILALCILPFSSCGGADRKSDGTIPSSAEAADNNITPSALFSDAADAEKYYEREFEYDEISKDLQRLFATSVSSEELQIIKNAWMEVPSEALRGVEAHIFVLLRALQDTSNSDITIVSAKFAPYSIEEKFFHMESTFGCDGYALQITDDRNNIYLVWDGFVYEKVVCNGEEIYRKYHVTF